MLNTFIGHCFFICLQLLSFFTCQQVLQERQVAFKVVENWPKFQDFGQISGISVDKSDKIYIFHRGNRRWDQYTFLYNNTFAKKGEGPIPNETIIVLEPGSGSLLTKAGKDMFYLPHGLTVDHDNNIWVTDVALHQVFKFSSLRFDSGSDGHLGTPLLTLGTAFEPGSDDKHFCKPTDVAIDEHTKDIYVSDGYCNFRIIKFDQNGQKLLSWGRDSIGDARNSLYMFNVPHALTLDQETKTLFVADRENFRGIAYNSVDGKYNMTYHEKIGNRAFSVAHSNIINNIEGGLLYTLINDDSTSKLVSVHSVKTGMTLLSIFPTNTLNSPHDLALSMDGQYCYIVELDPFKVWKLKIIFSWEFKRSNFSQLNQPLTSSLPHELVNEPKPLNSNVDSGSLFLAVGLVTSLILISFLIFIFHYNKSKGYRRYEMRRLILDDDDDDGNDIGGIRLS